METARERISKAISHMQPEVTPVSDMGFEDLPPGLERFGARDFAGPCCTLGMDVWETVQVRSEVRERVRVLAKSILTIAFCGISITVKVIP